MKKYWVATLIFFVLFAITGGYYFPYAQYGHGSVLGYTFLLFFCSYILSCIVARLVFVDWVEKAQLFVLAIVGAILIGIAGIISIAFFIWLIVMLINYPLYTIIGIAVGVITFVILALIYGDTQPSPDEPVKDAPSPPPSGDIVERAIKGVIGGFFAPFHSMAEDMKEQEKRRVPDKGAPVNMVYTDPDDREYHDGMGGTHRGDRHGRRIH